MSRALPRIDAGFGILFQEDKTEKRMDEMEYSIDRMHRQIMDKKDTGEFQVAVSAEGIRGKLARKKKEEESKIKRRATMVINERLESWGTPDGNRFVDNTLRCYPDLQHLNRDEVMPVVFSRLFSSVGGLKNASDHDRAIVNEVIRDFQSKGWIIEPYGDTPTLLLFSMETIDEECDIPE